MWSITNNIIIGPYYNKNDMDSSIVDMYRMHFRKRKLDGSLVEIQPDEGNSKSISNRVLKYGINIIGNKAYELIDKKTLEFIEKYKAG